MEDHANDFHEKAQATFANRHLPPPTTFIMKTLIKHKKWSALCKAWKILISAINNNIYNEWKVFTE